MKLPDNGSIPANCLLVAAGMFFGTFFTAIFHLTLPQSPFQENQRGSRPQSEQVSGQNSQDAEIVVKNAFDENNPASRSEMMRQAGAFALQNDPAQALRMGREFDSVQDRLDFHRGLFGEWAESDPVAALNHSRDNFASGSLRSETIGIVINKWGAEHPHEAWVWSQQNLSGPLKERAQTDLMIGWTRRSPEIAADWLTDSGLTSQPLINAVGRTWAEVEPLQAAAWASTLPDGIPQQTAEVAVASEWAAQDPEAASLHYTEAASQDNGINLAIALTDVWATTDPAATADWILGMPESSGRDQSAGALATIWAASDIDAAVKWGTQLDDPAMREQVITHLATTWGAIEPLDAIDWLNSLPVAEAQDGITGAFYSWAGTAPEQLREWIELSPSPELADRARLSLGDVYTSSDMPSALGLALDMNSEAARDQSAGRFFREWRKTNQGDAFDWLDTNWQQLPASTQATLERELNREVQPR